MFELSEQPLREDQLAKQLEDEQSGACVIFAGRVRRRNQQREVEFIEYEAAESETQAEFAKILSELREKHDVQGVRCVHRTGTVRVGEVAVWIGVSSVHRSPAFSACQYVINELKKRMPIWKKEHYSDGSAEWLNAEPS